VTCCCKARSTKLGRAILLCSVVSIAHADARVELSTGTEYSTGDFTQNVRTSVWYTPLGARVSLGNWSFRATVPYVSISAPADAIVLLDDDPTGVAGSGSGHRTEAASGQRMQIRTVSGIGDSPLAVSYSFNDLNGSPFYADFTGRVRLPTGDAERGTGVGATDYGFQGELGIDTGVGTVYVNGGRRFMGHVSGLQRVDGWQAGVGASLNVGRRTILGTYYDWRDASERDFPQPREVGIYLSVRMSRAWKVRFDASTSLEENGPNSTVGMMLYWRTVARSNCAD
jgi:opacity protein-like surface antigen